MTRYILDTNIVLHYLRRSKLAEKIEADLNLLNTDTIPLISVATVGELLSLGKQNNWGAKRMKHLETLLREMLVIDINNTDTDLMEAYSDIDAFSQGRLANKVLGNSSRNMGKNDLWIAATSKVADAPLITTDGDFDHLNSTFIKVIKYDNISNK